MTQINIRVPIGAMWMTYEYERRVEILLVLLHEFLIVLLCFLAIMFVEFGAKILLWRSRVLFLSVWGISPADEARSKVKRTGPLFVPPVPHSHPPSGFLDDVYDWI